MYRWGCMDLRGVDKVMINTDKIKANIELLISSGVVKNENELADMSLDKFSEVTKEFNICTKDLLCYFCFKSNGKCIDENCIKQ